jgi:hypothetical protein
MNKLLKKNQLIQFIILCCFYLLNKENNIKKHNIKDNNIKENINNCNDNDNDNDNDKIIEKESDLYIFFKKIVCYNNITQKFIKYIKKNEQIPNNNNDKLLENNEYFYLYYNKFNIYVYFYKEKESDIHNIYFNGINNKKDIEILLETVLRVLSNKFDFEHVENIIKKTGVLFEILPEEINKINFIENNKNIKNNLMKTFDYICKNHYRNENGDKINLNINGYSLGGIFSQVFVYLLFEKYNELCENKLNINFNTVESWFIGDEEKFKNYLEKTNFKNIFNKKSVFSYYNMLFQSSISNIHYISKDNNENDLVGFVEDNLYIFPFGLINYINKNHFLSKIFE